MSSPLTHTQHKCNVQQRTATYSRVQQNTARYNKVQHGTARYSKFAVFRFRVCRIFEASDTAHTRLLLTATFVFASGTRTAQGQRTATYSKVRHGTARYSKEQHGTATYSKVQQGTARYSTVQQGTARYSTVHHHTPPHITICRRAAGQHIQLSCVELMTIMSHSPGPEWLIKVLSLSVRPTASRERTPRYNTRNISAHHGTARHSTCSVAVIGMGYAGLVDVTVEGSASSCACK